MVKDVELTLLQVNDSHARAKNPCSTGLAAFTHFLHINKVT
jgi:hypothetical protein